MPPRNDPDTYGGVLTRPAATTVAVLVAIGAVLTVGWKAHDLITPAQGASLSDPQLREDVAELKEDMAVVMDRLGVDRNKRPAVRGSSIGR